MLHLWCQGAALLPALLFESLYSGFSVGRRTSFLHSIILNRPTADNSSLAFPPAAERCFFILRCSFSLLHCALWACGYRAWNQKTLTEYHRFFRSLFTDSFFDFFFLIFFWHGLYLDRTRGILDGPFFWLCLGRTRGILDGFIYWFCLHIKWFVWGRLVFNLIYANVFSNTNRPNLTNLTSVRHLLYQG